MSHQAPKRCRLARATLPNRSCSVRGRAGDPLRVDPGGANRSPAILAAAFVAAEPARRGAEQSGREPDS
jgi:hypothetical protein